MSITVETLSCKLTPEEAAERAQALAKLVRQIEEEETASKAAATAARETIRGMELDLRSLARIVREGRQVEVRRAHNLAEGTIETIRTDTGEVIGTRPMTLSERQIPLHLVEDEDVEAES